MIEQRKSSYCITGVPCIVEFQNIGEYSTIEWGIKGFKLPQSPEFRKIKKAHPVVISLTGNRTLAVKANICIQPNTEGGACFRFRGLSASGRISLLSMVIAASTLLIARSYD